MKETPFISAPEKGEDFVSWVRRNVSFEPHPMRDTRNGVWAVGRALSAALKVWPSLGASIMRKKWGERGMDSLLKGMEAAVEAKSSLAETKVAAGLALTKWERFLGGDVDPTRGSGWKQGMTTVTVVGMALIGIAVAPALAAAVALAEGPLSRKADSLSRERGRLRKKLFDEAVETSDRERALECALDGLGLSKEGSGRHGSQSLLHSATMSEAEKLNLAEGLSLWTKWGGDREARIDLTYGSGFEQMRRMRENGSTIEEIVGYLTMDFHLSPDELKMESSRSSETALRLAKIHSRTDLKDTFKDKWASVAVRRSLEETGRCMEKAGEALGNVCGDSEEVARSMGEYLDILSYSLTSDLDMRRAWTEEDLKGLMRGFLKAESRTAFMDGLRTGMTNFLPFDEEAQDNVLNELEVMVAAEERDKLAEAAGVTSSMRTRRKI